MKTVTSLLVISSLCFGTSLSEPINTSLVVYNANRALVHETREVSLQKKDTFIIYDNVANSIDADSVNVKLPTSVKLISQQYRYDQLSLHKLLEANVNKEVKIKISDHKQQKVTLLSTSGLVQDKRGEVFSVKAQDIIFDNLPSTLFSKPSLVWNVNVARNSSGMMSLDYLISNISFTSNYTLNIEKNSADLTGWMSVKNNSGKSFKDVSLSFLAGDVNFANKSTPRVYKAMAVMAESDSVAVQEQSFSGYHHYKLPFKVDLSDHQTTQVKFLSLEGVKIKRSYIANLQNPLYFRGEQQSSAIQQISFKAPKQPLPSGTMRIYGKLDSESVLLGESHINHTPKNKSVDLSIGKEFDLKVTQTLMQRDEQKHSLYAKLLYTLTNASKEKKTLTLHVPFEKSATSKVTSQEKYSYTKGNLVTFIIELKPNTTKQFKVEFQRKR